MRTIEKMSCFVIMPFSKANVGDSSLSKEELDFIYSDIIKKAVLDYELNNRKVFSEVYRSEARFGSLINGIIGNLNNADLVIADLTGLNPNVMYELGVRHSLKRGTLIITQDINSLPSDLRDYACIEYGYSDKALIVKERYNEFKNKLHEVLTEMLLSEKIDSPVLNYLNGKEKYWREDELQKLKENIIISNYIHEQVDSIQDSLKLVDIVDKEELKDKFVKISFWVSNLANALSDLNISIQTAMLYEDIIAAKQTIMDIQKESLMSDYFSNYIAPLATDDAPNFDMFTSRFFERKYTNHFSLLEGLYDMVSIKDIFSEEGGFQINFLDELESYLENKAHELGLNQDQIDYMLQN